MNKTVREQSLLFYISLGIYIVLSIINTSMFAKYIMGKYKLIMVLCFLLLIVRELTNKMQEKRMKLWCLTAIIVGISLLAHSGANSILTILIFSAAASDLDFDEVGDFAFKTILVCLLTVLICSRVGIIKDYVYVMAGKPRHYLGFLYALQPAGLILELIVLNLYLHRKDKRNTGKWFLLILGIYIFLMTKSRLTFFLEIVMFAADFLYRNYKKVFANRLLLLLEKCSYILCPVISFYLAMTYKNQAWKRALNDFLANRLGYSQNSLVKYGIKLFGQPISWSGMGLSQNGVRTLESVASGYDWVDNAYVQLFQLYGIIVAVFFLAAIMAAIYYMIKQKQYYLSFIVALYSAYGMIDTACLSLLYNMMMLAVFGFIIKKKSRTDLEPSKALILNIDEKPLAS